MQGILKDSAPSRDLLMIYLNSIIGPKTPDHVKTTWSHSGQHNQSETPH